MLWAQSTTNVSDEYKLYSLSPSYSFHKSLYHKSCCCCFLAYLYSAGNRYSTREPASSRVTYFILRATANTEKIGRGLEKNTGKWTGRVEISKEEIPGSKRSMYAKFDRHPSSLVLWHRERRLSLTDTVLSVKEPVNLGITAKLLQAYSLYSVRLELSDQDETVRNYASLRQATFSNVADCFDGIKLNKVKQRKQALHIIVSLISNHSGEFWTTRAKVQAKNIHLIVMYDYNWVINIVDTIFPISSL